MKVVSKIMHAMCIFYALYSQTRLYPFALPHACTHLIEQLCVADLALQVDHTQSTSMRAFTLDSKALPTQIGTNTPIGFRFRPPEANTPGWTTQIVGEVYRIFQGMGRLMVTYASVATLTLVATIRCFRPLSSFMTCETKVGSCCRRLRSMVTAGLLLSRLHVRRLRGDFHHLALCQHTKVPPPTSTSFRYSR
jgi:hypothetical protein